MLKYHFSIRTRSGQSVDNIRIGGIDQADAERRLRQMYSNCEVTRCEVKRNEGRIQVRSATANGGLV